MSIRALQTIAPGKVNLCLFVGRPREDGMHPLVSLIQPLDVADGVSISPLPGARADEVVCEGVSGPNLAAHALEQFRCATDWAGEALRVTIDKRLPVAAGMGGGSADAAAVLRALRVLAGPATGETGIGPIAARLGSDVPAALLAQRCLITSAGEQVESLPEPPPLAAVVIPSRSELPTPDVYREFDRLGGGRGPEELDELAEQVRTAGTGGLLPVSLQVNDLEQAALSLMPSLAGVLARVRDLGCDQALVSGSGPTVVGLFSGPDPTARAESAKRGLVHDHPAAFVASRLEHGAAEVLEA